MKRVVSIVLILGAFLILIGLGTWQKHRLAWKEGLIAQAQLRPDLPAQSLETLIADAGISPVTAVSQTQAEAVDRLVYRRALARGRFVGEPVRVFTTLSDPNGPYEGPGYWIMQPFEVAGAANPLVFVNRGFVPYQLPATARIAPAPAGTIQFEGLVRPDDPPDAFTPDPDYEDATLYRRSIAQLMQAGGVETALPLTLDMPSSAIVGALPQAGETKFAFSNRHFEYMLTWYGLAAVLAGVVATTMLRRRSMQT